MSVFSNYVDYLGSQRPLTTEEEVMIYYNLCIQPDNHKLRQRLIEGHLPYVLKIAKLYGKRGIEFRELLSTLVLTAYELGSIYCPGQKHDKCFGVHLVSELKHAISRLFKIKSKEIPSEEMLTVLDNHNHNHNNLLDIIDDIIMMEFKFKRDILEYKLRHGYSNRKISRLVGVSAWTVDHVVKRGKTRLAKRLSCQE